MTAATNTRSRGRTHERTNVVTGGMQPTTAEPLPAPFVTSQPQHEYQPVGVGGTRKPIIVAGQEVGEEWAGQSWMKLREIPGHPNQLGWWIDEMGKELIFEYFSPDHIYRSEMIDALNPAHAMLEDWLNLQRDLTYSSIASDIARSSNPAATMLLSDEWAELRHRQAQAINNATTICEAIASVVVVSPRIVRARADEGEGRLWVKRIPTARLDQLFGFLREELQRVQDYFRQARRALPCLDALPPRQR